MSVNNSYTVRNKFYLEKCISMNKKLFLILKIKFYIYLSVTIHDSKKSQAYYGSIQHTEVTLLHELTAGLNHISRAMTGHHK